MTEYHVYKAWMEGIERGHEHMTWMEDMDEGM